MTHRSAALTVDETGPLTTVQDAGRFGLAALGIGRSGACDRTSYRRANRLVGNDERAAVLEVTFGGLAVRADADVVVALTGARCEGTPHNAVFTLPAGSTLRLGAPASGLRTYLAVRGGVAVPEVLGSRSTDVLAGLGPETVAPGDVLPVGAAPAGFPLVDSAAAADPAADEIRVRVIAGPRREWVTDEGWGRLLGESYEVTSESNRVGLRLEGPALDRSETGELRSEGMARGALQVPPSGLPVLFLADHPVTGGYPVVGYVHDDDVDRCAQLQPGQRMSFRQASSAASSR